MAIALSEVDSFCTPAERTLVQSSREPYLDRLTTGQLKQHADRARKLWLKWQRLSRKHRGDPEHVSSSDHGRTDSKLAIFREALDQFETHLGEIGEHSRQRPEKHHTHQPGHEIPTAVDTETKSTEVHGRPRASAHPQRSEAQVDRAKQLKADAAAKEAKFAQSGATHRIQAHMASAARRSQAQRDGKS